MNSPFSTAVSVSIQFFGVCLSDSRFKLMFHHYHNILNRWDSTWRDIDNVRAPQLHAADSSSHVLILDTTDSHQRHPGFKKAPAPVLHRGHDCHTVSYTVVCFWMPTQLHAYSA